MDLIRRANPYPHELGPLPMDAVRQRLAEEESRWPAIARRIPRPNLGGALTAISAAVALAIAVLAITALGHHPRTTVTGSSPLASSRHQLVETLGVLRRPQTKTDLLATQSGGGGGDLPGIFWVRSAGACRGRTSSLLPCTVRLDTPLVRAVTLGHGYRAAIFPAKIERASTRAAPGEGVVIAMRGPGLYIITSMTPTSTQALRDHGLLLSDYVASGIDRGVMLVPDGVARVTLDDFRLLAPYTSRLDQIPPTTSTVKDNLALLQITGLTEQELGLNPHTLGRYNTQDSGQGCQITFAVYSLPATARMTWFGPGHRPVRSISIQLRLDVGTHHPAPGTTGRIGPARAVACSKVH